MKARVKWVEGALMLGESGSGHAIVMDGPEEHGGRNLGVRPMEMLLLGMGGCSEFDVVHILKKTRQDVRFCEVELMACALPRGWQGPDCKGGRAGGEAQCRKVLFGLDHAGKDG